MHTGEMELRVEYNSSSFTHHIHKSSLRLSLCLVASHAWSTLVYDWLLSTGAVAGDDVNRDHDATSGANASARSPNVAIESERAGAKGGGHGAPRRPPARAARGVPRSSHEGFFSLSLERWLSERGAGLSLERCSSSGPPEVRCGTHVGLRLSRQWWWPFNCSS